MAGAERRQIGGHEMVEVKTSKPYQPYDRLVLRSSKGRTISTVLLCEPAASGWSVTAIRCPSGCRMHRRNR